MLRKYFNNNRLAELSQTMDLDEPSGLDYYPLVKPGERFPVYDPKMPPRMEPRPGDSLPSSHDLSLFCGCSESSYIVRHS